MDIKIYNTLSREKEVFVPIKKGRVSMYACGPTVYDFAHIGNFRTFIFEDILHRTLLEAGYEVLFVQNITDVGHLTGDRSAGEDKIEQKAKEENKTAQEIANIYTEIYKEDSKKLNILPADILAKATEHISEQIEMIKLLEQRGFAYKTSDGIYFDTSKLKDYGKLANLDIEKLKEGARVEINTEKKNPTDFALWKFSKPEDKRQMEWDSPWGVGFPGWHIECSAMSIKYLGVPFDIHAGGADFIPLHHTNEIAQNEGAYGTKTVNHWLHGGFLAINNEKMSKSLKNIYSLKDLEEKNYDPLDFRYFSFTAHYRKPLNFSWEALTNAKNSYNNLLNKVADFLKEESKDVEEDKISKHIKSFEEALYDDLKMPEVLALVWQTVGDQTLNNSEKLFLLDKFDKILGLSLKENAQKKNEENKNIPDKILELARERELARKEKDWERADTLRQEIENLGYILKDSPTGPEIEKTQ